MGRNRYDRSQHISEDEIKKGILIFVLIAVLVVIAFLIVLLMIPRKNNNGEQEYYGSTVSEQKGDSKNKVDNTVKTERDNSKVNLSLRSVTNSSAIIIIEDKNTVPYDWFPVYSIEKKVNDNWEEMVLKNPENMIFADAPLDMNNGIVRQSLVWSDKYGVLESGEYRIVKETEGQKFYAEFEIN